MNKDLTVGRPSKVIVGYTVPLFAGVIFQQLYNVADSIIAGKYADGLAAVGASFPVTMLFMAVAIGCQIGCSVVIGRNFGSGDRRATKTCITTSVIAGAVISLILTVAGTALSTLFVRLLNTPAECFDDAAVYLRIYTAGYVFLFLYNVATGIFNSLGDGKTPLYLLIGSSLSNIILDAVFVIVFHWGVAGVAWATFIAQGAACILALFILYRRTAALYTGKDTALFDIKALKETAAVSIPGVLQQSFISVGNMFIQYIVNSYGKDVLDGYTAAIKLNTFAIVCFSTIGNGMSGFAAQNNGARKPERIKSGITASAVFAVSASALFFIVFRLFSRDFIGLFMNENSTALSIQTGIDFLAIVSPGYFLISCKMVFDGLLRGCEKMVLFMISTFVDLILKVALAFVLSELKGETGVWYANPVSWIFGCTLSIIFAVTVLKKNMSEMQTEQR